MNSERAILAAGDTQDAFSGDGLQERIPQSRAGSFTGGPPVKLSKLPE